MSFTSLTATEPVEEMVRRFEFWVRCHRRKAAAGEGDHAVGDLLPGWFAQLGLADLEVHQTDRAISYYPPYNTAAQQALIAQEREWRRSGTGPWNREDLKRNVLRGGGSEQFFEAVFAELERRFEQEHQAIEAGTLHVGFAGHTHLVSGLKPTAAVGQRP